MKPEIVFALENANWPALIVEATGQISRANVAAVETLGPIQERVSDLSAFWSPENTANVSGFLSSASELQTPTLIKLKLKDRSTTAFSAQVAPMGATKLFLLQLFKSQTPTEKKTSPENVDANVAQKQKLDCAMQLARTVALDFNNALTSVLGHTSLLLSRAESDHPWRSSLVEIEKSAERAAEIASDLANFSRQEKSTGRQTGNLNELLRQTVEAFRVPNNSHITWDVQFERKLFAAAFDEAKLQQAFAKVLENAVEAIGQDGKITVMTRNLQTNALHQDGTVRLAPGTYVCVEITDTGSGIPLESLPRIFEPFFTTKGTGHRGLGLAWVYGIVTNHGGGVAISSVANEGTSVRVYLPATKRLVKEADTGDDLCGIETVLIVDDEDLLLNMAQTVLSAFGYRALVANSGRKALEILSTEMVDLVVTDLVMPQMSGRELVERIETASPNIRIVTSSGYLRPGNQSDEFYLQKPFTAQELLRKVRQALATEQNCVS
jgi:two-component system cell cycle sensor histidine kinase/response regulator CckA